uniref:Uncharacterized protein n=1 Tax=Nelumbo nucifera TaxID=4432 RepID=A0A822ZFY6_NELNU|nr:TPA_asm: hypothetical protein HUJ06_003294 [Nelumbo nucifera]
MDTPVVQIKWQIIFIYASNINKRLACPSLTVGLLQIKWFPVREFKSKSI